MPAGAWAPHGNDWVVLRIATLPSAAASNGFVGSSEVVDVTAFWALSGEAVHHFDKPLEIVLRSTTDALVPATSDGSWVALRRVPTAGTLPSGWVDGFFRDGSGYHDLTLHLSQFTLLRDVQAPAPPADARG